MNQRSKLSMMIFFRGPNPHQSSLQRCPLKDQDPSKNNNPTYLFPCFFSSSVHIHLSISMTFSFDRVSLSCRSYQVDNSIVLCEVLHRYHLQCLCNGSIFEVSGRSSLPLHTSYMGGPRRYSSIYICMVRDDYQHLPQHHSVIATKTPWQPSRSMPL